MKTTHTLLAAALAALAPSIALASCGASFCAVNTNWTAESALTEASDAFDLRYEYMNQDQPMSGSDKVSVGQVPSHHDEVSTQNRNVVLSYGHNFGNGFGLTVSAAAVQREHFHIHNHHGAKIGDSWKFTALNDARIIGRYQLTGVADPLKPASAGITFGVKLPTGKYDESNAQGARAERSMQPGSGTMDLIAGSYYHQKLTALDASWFAQAQYQHAINTRENFRPGAQLGVDVGVRKGLAGGLGIQGQLNYVHKSADSGSEAEPASSGGRFLYASPGLSYALSKSTQLYAFYQVPLHRHVTGVQLTANRALVIGLSARL
ncbi:transporter [Massilia sp. TSP1-1-2]|uniref:transporter n=1 Tax=Massilia sp. TSP1-1-2 TaxID=2804649 RepID=UPI003CE6C4FC